VFLEKLEILGFKSFARKTVFQFNSGITGVVGPNGCGKSNIVDAIRWVLGEQKAGTLRSERMENVIFNGSLSQKPLGMAEVSMTIKNTKNLLPVEYTEVVVTRRLFRSGESQYLLNNTVCRLKDILNLFMDSGMGFDAYSVIELKMVEQILNGRPEERRKIFEQAAGISKYKKRRIAAMQKLENTEKDLIRVNDIISEVQKKVESLGRQVSKARRYQEIQEKLNELEFSTATTQFSKILDNLDPVVDNYERIKKDQESISTKLDLYEADIESFRTQLIQVEQKLSVAQQKLNTINRQIQQKESDLLLARERINSIKESNRKDQTEQTELSERVEKLHASRHELSQQLEKLKLELTELEQNYLAQKAVYSHSEGELNQKRQQQEALEKKMAGVVTESAALNTQKERAKIQIEHLKQRLGQLEKDDAGFQTNQRTVDQELAQMEQRVENNGNDLERKTGELETLEGEISQDLQMSEEFKDVIFKGKNRIDGLENRIALLRRVMDSFEDYPEGVRHLMLEKGKANGFWGAVADYISIPEEYRLALDAYLGELATYLITENVEDALNGILVLKTAKKGVVAFTPIPLVGTAKTTETALDQIAAHPSVLGRADRLLTCQEKIKPLLNNILKHCFFVGDFETAQNLAREFEGAHASFVSIRGELATSQGVLKGGNRSGKETGPLGRADELKKLETQQAELYGQVEDTELKRTRLVQELERRIKNRDLLNSQIKGLNQEKTKLEISNNQLKYQQKQTSEQLARNQAESATIHTEIHVLEEKLTGLVPQLEKLSQERSELESQIEQIRHELGGLEKENAILANKVHELNVKVVGLKGEQTNTEREYQQSVQLAEEYDRTIQAKSANIKNGYVQIEQLKSQVDIGNKELEDEFVQQEEIENVVHKFEAERSELSRQIDEIGRKVRGFRFDRDQLSDKGHQLELQISELKLKAENIEQRMRDEFNIQIKREKIDPTVSLDEMKTELEALKNRIKSLGPVNLLAIEEYDVEKERYDFLVSQQSDLFQARDTLMETIELINKTAQSQFAEIYEIIRTNFKEVFHGFFPNGEADLAMAETGDVLENEIEVVASTKGKRLGSLALLSGGEKTLTAISLLFAIYLVKPSPFCILDEVDAPLDDMNIDRFINAIKKFSNNTQFILVTHNKLTMKAADSLYGITMAQDGVSKVVSVKMERDAVA
jgi:chromosome segregation protein